MMNRSLVLKGMLATAPLVVGVVVADAARRADDHRKAADTSTQLHIKTEPTPAATTQVNVNGRDIPVGEDGKIDLTIPGNNASVHVSDGRTSVTTESTPDVSDSHPGNVDVNVFTESSSGTSRSTTRIQTHESNRNGTSKSSTSTHVFSTGSGNSKTSP